MKKIFVVVMVCFIVIGIVGISGCVNMGGGDNDNDNDNDGGSDDKSSIVSGDFGSKSNLDQGQGIIS